MENTAKTVRVRIAVVVSNDGEFQAYGSSCDNDAQASSEAQECHTNDGIEGYTFKTYFIEADVDTPEKQEPETIEGEVV